MRLSPPKSVTWLIALALYAFAVANRFGVIHAHVLATWAWIFGFGLLLAGCLFRGL